MSRPVLITGATGLVGATLTRALVETGTPVRVLRRESSTVDLLGPAAATVEHVFGDVTDIVSVDEAMQGVEAVYHVAATLGSGRSSDREALRAVNVGGTANVVNAALRAGVRRLVHTSSMAAFGRPARADVVLDETSEWTPSTLNGLYATSKHDAEREVHRGLAEGLDAVIVNPALIFGVGRPGENTVQIVEMVRDRRVPAIPAGGTCVVDVRDVAEGLVRAMALGKTGRRYFLGVENLSWETILGTLARAYEVSLPRRRLPRRLALVAGAASEAVGRLARRSPSITRERARQMSAFYRYDNTRARTELGVTFRPFAETAATLAAAFPKR